ncbi:pseudouridylate synthase RPUSD2-like isoform X2 [Symsagittifera roscoffensis]|uniref:pseudouridylate synthase RPUSD2-like isoform X2 n=1 Tax=Symsagittifera roscoffensis TaxID=84072 RepID=UPI00307C904B
MNCSLEKAPKGTEFAERWVGSKLKDIYVNEFRGESEETLLKRFKAGNIKVNGDPVEADYLIKDNDFLEATMHRHEMPVKSDELSILHNDNNFYVVNKPASIPVHPAGRFRYNSLSFILGKTYGLKNLSTVHRLDRLTSGCQIFAKNLKTSQQCFEALKNRKVSKMYVTGLHGDFSSEEIRCDAPIAPICSRIGINAVSESRGQNSVTIFNKVLYDRDKDISVVLCQPLTGRTHQIRVHAQYLGHHVINDPLYGTDAWGNSEGRNIDDLKEDEQQAIIAKLKAEHDNSCGMEWRKKNKFIKHTKTEEELKAATDTQSAQFDPICEECGVDYEDPPLNQLEIYLHAYKYQMLHQTFTAPLPHWAAHHSESIERLANKLFQAGIKDEEKPDECTVESNQKAKGKEEIDKKSLDNILPAKCLKTEIM